MVAAFCVSGNSEKYNTILMWGPVSSLKKIPFIKCDTMTLQNASFFSPTSLLSCWNWVPFSCLPSCQQSSFNHCSNINSILKPWTSGTYLIVKIGACFRKVNVKPHYCRINFENASSKGSKGSNIQFLLVVGETNLLLHLICYILILKSRMSSVHIDVFNVYWKVHCSNYASVYLFTKSDHQGINYNAAKLYTSY